MPNDFNNLFIENWKPRRGCGDVLKVWNEVMPTVRKILLKVEIKNMEQACDYLATLSRHTAARFSGGNVINDLEKLFSEDALAATLGSSLKNTRAKSTRPCGPSCRPADTSKSALHRYRYTILRHTRSAPRRPSGGYAPACQCRPTIFPGAAKKRLRTLGGW